MMDKLQALFVVLGIFILSVSAAPTSSTAFEQWFANFDPSKERASKSTDCTGKSNDFYANEPDTCSATYYACATGLAYQQTCPSGQVFDNPAPPAAKGCKTPQLATSSACRTYPLPSCNPDNEGVFQPTEECGNLYYICIGGNIIFQRCGTGEIFDPVTLTCIDNTGPDACIRVTTPSTTSSSTEATTIETSITSTVSTPSTSARPLPTAPCYTCGNTNNTPLTMATTSKPLLPTAPCTACSKNVF